MVSSPPESFGRPITPAPWKVPRARTAGWPLLALCLGAIAAIVFQRQIGARRRHRQPPDVGQPAVHDRELPGDRSPLRRPYLELERTQACD